MDLLQYRRQRDDEAEVRERRKKEEVRHRTPYFQGIIMHINTNQRSEISRMRIITCGDASRAHARGDVCHDGGAHAPARAHAAGEAGFQSVCL